jgi:tRNA A37 threonylcarbamoyladenosine modification protein TsaB
MRILFLDLASHDGTLACVTEQSVIAVEQIDHRIGDSAVIPRFQAVLDRVGWTDRDLTNIACITGPGGFTSLRVAVSMANALAHTLEIPMAGIHLSDFYHARAPGAKIWLHSTKADRLFMREYSGGEAPLISIQEIPREASWTGELIETHRVLMEEKKCETLPLIDVLPDFLAHLQYKQESLVPWYGREG